MGDNRQEDKCSQAFSPAQEKSGRARRDTNLLRVTFLEGATRNLMMFPRTNAVPSAKMRRPAVVTSIVPLIRCATFSRSASQQNQNSRTLFFVRSCLEMASLKT